MADVYILYSKHLGKHYIGSCKDADGRLDEHLTKVNANSFTSKAEDWEAVLVRL